MRRSLGSAALLCLLALHTASCSSYVYHHAIQGDARQQIWLADASQVKVRAAQSRLFETADRGRTIEAVVAVLQDLDFQIEVLDEAFGVARQADKRRGEAGQGRRVAPRGSSSPHRSGAEIAALEA